jgi:UDP-N-acetylmuramoyl-L-alanyl-D-glutamate--2,6-diaminopimelate ligase
MKLVELASLLALSRIEGDGNTEITGIETDSRNVCPGDLFICLSGHTVNGHEFATKAVDNGAVAVVIQDEVEVNVPKIIVPDSRYAMAVFSNHFYAYPSKDMKVIGV